MDASLHGARPKKSKSELGNVVRTVSDKAAFMAKTAVYKAASAAHIYGSLAADTVKENMEKVQIGEFVEKIKDDINDVVGTHTAALAAAFLDGSNAEEDEEEVELQASDYDLLLAASGAQEKKIDAGSLYTQCYLIPAGHTMVWKCLVDKGDIGFGIRLLVDSSSKDKLRPSSELDLEPMDLYRPERPIIGTLKPVAYPRRVNMTFDNTHSGLASKDVAYWVAIGANVSHSDELVGGARTLERTAADNGPR